jgi:excisionase family DNA binding protein
VQSIALADQLDIFNMSVRPTQGDTSWSIVMNTMISISEVQSLLNVSRATVNRLLDRGELGRVHIGRAVRISSEDVAAFVQRLRAAE